MVSYVTDGYANFDSVMAAAAGSGGVPAEAFWQAIRFAQALAWDECASEADAMFKLPDEDYENLINRNIYRPEELK